MGKRFAIVIGVAALGAAVITTGANADFTSVNDPRGDTVCPLHKQHCSDQAKRNADIVRATAGHDGTRLKHTIRVVGKFHEGGLQFNTDSDPLCERHLKISRKRSGVVLGCDRGTRLTKFGRARYDFHRHSVEISFSKRSIGNPGSYSWNASAFAGRGFPIAEDDVPNQRPFGWIPHHLDHSGAAAVGMMALGVQTAAAAPAVVKYDTEVTITDREQSSYYQGLVESEVRKCELGRRVVLLQRRPGADLRLGTDRSRSKSWTEDGYWAMVLGRAKRPGVYAKVRPAERDGFVCRADRSAVYPTG